ncbi:MAG: exodeoxyribonuclease VII large subunit [Xanthomonadales bacterium]|nr:exodeoxyribonuclease VII large subunit [Xanthomonadales bacterium]
MRNVYTPSELNREVRLHLEAGFPRLWIEGEISNLARPPSGHLYFTLKDERAQLSVTLFRSHAGHLGFRPENGALVQVRGRLGLYEARGQFQLVADSMEAAGEGRLRAAFEALKRRLEEEGLFDPALKRPLPDLPRRIAVITSPGGAVIRDIINVLSRRWPLAEVRLYPVPVQGEEAAPAIVRALASVDAHGWADAVILGRGGGSLEDLWPFNEESVARAIHGATVPIVSAVGHETDTSISDFVADLRAPTPSAAAELLTPDRAQLARRFEETQGRLHRRIQSRLQGHAQRLDELGERIRGQHPSRRLLQQRTQLEQLERRARVALRRQLTQKRAALPVLKERLSTQLADLLPRRRERLGALARTLHAVSPLPTLERGYSVTLDARTGASIRSATALAPGDSLETVLADGRVISTVESVTEAALSGAEPVSLSGTTS